jgi:hypothetical protein
MFQDEGTVGDADILVEFEPEGVCTRAQAGENIMKVIVGWSAQ